MGCFYTIILLSSEVLYAQHVFVEQPFSHIFPGCSGMLQISSVLNVCCALILGMGLPEGTERLEMSRCPFSNGIKLKYKGCVWKWHINHSDPYQSLHPHCSQLQNEKKRLVSQSKLLIKPNLTSAPW